MPLDILEKLQSLLNPSFWFIFGFFIQFPTVRHWFLKTWCRSSIFRIELLVPLICYFPKENLRKLRDFKEDKKYFKVSFDFYEQNFKGTINIPVVWHFLSFLVKHLEDILEHTLHNGRLKTLFCKKAFETLIMIIVNFYFCILIL